MPIKMEVLVILFKIAEKRLEDAETPREEDWKEVYEEFHKYVDGLFHSGIGANISTMCRKSDELFDKVFRSHMSAIDTN